VELDQNEEPSGASLDRAAARLLELLTDSVRLRLRSDVAVGSCLSGGLDSSTIVSLIRRLQPASELHTFTGRFPGFALDEGRYASLVSAANQTVSHEVEPTAARFAAEAPALYWHADFPLGGMSQFAQWCVFGLARENGVTVLLDGQGSDEQLGGYGGAITTAFLRELLARGRFRSWFKERKLAQQAQGRSFDWPHALIASLGVPGLEAGIRRVRRGIVFRDLLDADWVRETLGALPELPERDNPKRAVGITLWTLTFRTMLSSLLRFGDRLSMAHSREVRLPFCDHRIAEFAFGLAPELLVGEGQAKGVLRKAIDGLVPPEIVHRAKQGFQPPQDEWVQGLHRALTADLLTAPGPVAEIMDRRRMLRSGDTGDASVRWQLLNTLCWSRHSLERMRALPHISATLS